MTVIAWVALQLNSWELGRARSVLGFTPPRSSFPPNEANFICVTQKQEMKQKLERSRQTLL